MTTFILATLIFGIQVGIITLLAWAFSVSFWNVAIGYVLVDIAFGDAKRLLETK